MRKKRGKPNPSYAGYEYQILTSVWIGLDLILGKNITNEIIIEPRSHEDVEAALNVKPNVGWSSANASAGPTELIVQVKSRSTGAWSARDFSKILLGKEEAKTRSLGKKTKKGPAARLRPMRLLCDDQMRHFVFVTDSGLQTSLVPHMVEALLESPGTIDLPPYVRSAVLLADRESVAGRIAILAQVTAETLESRIRKLLSFHGHVPILKHDDCLKDMREEVRMRLLGAKDGCWTRGDILRLLVRHGGSLLPTRKMDQYVPPRSFASIEQRLDERNAVVIVGPSGTGKTLTGEILEEKCCQGGVGYLVIGAEHGPGMVRTNLKLPGPILFHLRDPWGTNRLEPLAERWTSELPKLLAEAAPDKKFIVTSRSDILYEARLRDKLRSFEVAIEIEDYDLNARREIYTNLATDLVGRARAFADHVCDEVVRKLRRPFEIERFIVALAESQLNPKRELAALIERSQIDAISDVVAEQVRGWGGPRPLDALQPAAIVWALLAAHDGAISSTVLTKVRRELAVVDKNSRPDVEGLVDFMVAGRNLKKLNDEVSFYHPRVEAGLRDFVQSYPADAEYVLGLLCEALLELDGGNESDWGAETVVGVYRQCKKLKGVAIKVSREMSNQLDVYLERIALDATTRDFESAFRHLGEFGSKDHRPSVLARMLIRQHDAEELNFGDFWSAPKVDRAYIESVRSDPSCVALVHHFIEKMLASTRAFYTPKLVPFVRSLAASTEIAFLKALESAGDSNLDTIVEGALAGDDPPWDRILDKFLAAQRKVDEWMDGFKEEYRKAEEHEIDAQEADWVVEEPSERYYYPHTGLETVVRSRRLREGFSWLTHLEEEQKRILLPRWIEVVAKENEQVTIEEIEAILDTATNEGERARAWSAAAAHWSHSLEEQLRREIARPDLGDPYLRVELIETFAIAIGVDWLDALVTLSRSAPKIRRLEIALDLVKVRLKSDLPDRRSGSTRAHAYAASLEVPLRQVAERLLELMEGEDIREVSNRLSDDEREVVRSVLSKASSELAAPLVCLAAAVGIDVLPLAARLLGFGTALAGYAAVLALSLTSTETAQVELKRALEHVHYPVRRAAMEQLAALLPQKDRAPVLAMARDRSADLRLAFANLMSKLRWPEAIDALVTLLRDHRDFNAHPDFVAGRGTSVYRVACAAAAAIGSYSDLAGEYLSRIIAEAAQPNGDDPFVTCALLDALAKRSDARIDQLLIDSLKDRGFEESGEIYKPIAQSAAWNIFDRSLAQSLNLDRVQRDVLVAAANDAEASIAGPAILSIASLRDAAATVMAREKFRESRSPSRGALLLVSAALSNAGEEGLTFAKWEVEKSAIMLARLISETANIEVAKAAALVNEEITRWSRALNSENDVEGLLAALLNKSLDLPISVPKSDIRKPRVPKRIRTLSLRSLTEMREEIEDFEEYQ